MHKFLTLKSSDRKKVLLVIFSVFFVMSFIGKVRAIVPELYNTENAKREFEQINPYNGHLSFTVPVGTLGTRGNLTFTPSISIETFWETHWLNYPDQTGGNNDISYAFPPLYTSSFHTYLGYLTQDSVGGSTQSCDPQHPNASNVDYGRTHTRITFHAPDGSSIPLKDVMNNGAVLSRQPCSTYRPSRGTVFVGEGDSSMTFVSDNEIFDTRINISNPPPSDLPLSGTLYLKDGTRYRYNGSRMTVIDRNGNLLTDANTVTGQGYTITDSAGREMKYSSQLSDPYDPQTYILEYKSTGISGQPRTITVRHNFLHNRLRADYEQRAKYCAAELFPTIGCLSGPNGDEAHDPYVISTIELPNGKAFQFYYNHYGELARVVYPEGGAVEYDHFQVRQLLPGNWQTRIIHRAVQEKRVYPNGETGNNYETKTNYEYSYSDHTETTETITDSNGNFVSRIKHYLFGEPYTDFSPNGRFGGEVLYPYQYGLQAKEYKTEFFNSLNTIIKTVDTQWQQADGSNSATAILNSPRVVQIKTTLNDTGQISHTDFEYDQYVNQTDAYEYDYGTTQPVRHTHNDYISDSNYTSVSGGHLRSLPSATQIYGYQNGQPFLATQNEIKYDETPLMSRSSVFGWLDPQRLTRGNATKTRKWLKYGNEAETWIETKAEYDVLGNVVTTIDAKNYTSLIDYTDRFGIADNEARSNTPPARLDATTTQPQLYTFAFPTKITNVDFNWTTYSQFDYNTGKIVNTEDINGVISKTIYNDRLDRPTQTVIGIGTDVESQSTIIYDDDYRRTQTTSDLRSLNDNLIKSESFYDGLGRIFETHQYESTGGFITIKSIPFIMVQDPETSAWRAAIKVSNPYRSNETPIWTVSLNDSLARNIKTISPDGNIIKTEYSGNAITLTDQAGKMRRTIMNALGQLKRVDEPTIIGLGAIDAPNQPTNYTYDTLGNLTQVQQNGTGEAQCGANNASCSQTRTFTYDSLSRLKSVLNPESGTISYSYDNNSNLTNKTNARGVQTTYVYDAQNRPTNLNYSNELSGQPTTPNVVYTYDTPSIAKSKGKLTKVSAIRTGVNAFSASTEYLEFDAMGRVKQSKQMVDGVNYGSTAQLYTYNLAGALVEETYPSGRVVKSILDTDGDISLVQSKKTGNAGYFNYAKSFTYTAAGAVNSMQLGNGRWESIQFNSRLQPKQIALGTTQNSTDQLKLNFEYGKLDANGAVIAGTNNGNVAKQFIIVPTVGTNPGFSATQYYAYDELNRLRQASESITQSQTTINTWSQTFDYDRYGNRHFNETYTTASPSFPKSCGTVQNPAMCAADQKMYNPQMTVANNRLIEDQDNDSIKEYEYDAAGNVKKDMSLNGARTFNFDAENKQIEVKNLGGQSIGQDFYDGDGKRVKKVNPQSGETTIFMYDALGKIVAEYSTTVESVSTARVSYLTMDHLGSPRIITDANGNPIARHDYQPFGEEIDGATTAQRNNNYNNSADTIRQKFTAYERDTETPDHDFAQARRYANKLGRFTTVDSAVPDEYNPQTFNNYQYCLNNPLKFVDRNGQYEEEVHRDLTVALAYAVGFDGAEAQAIGAADQWVDDNPKTDPLQLGVDGYNARVEYHFTSQATRDGHWAKFENFVAQGDSQAYAALGTFEHTQQDSFSHEGFGAKIGQVAGGADNFSILTSSGNTVSKEMHKYDDTTYDPEKAIRMAKDTFTRLLKARNMMANSGRFGSFRRKPIPYSRIAGDVNKWALANTREKKKVYLDSIIRTVNRWDTEQSVPQNIPKQKRMRMSVSF